MQYQCNIANMTLENYASFFKAEIYPLDKPYDIRTGLRTIDNKFSLIVQLGTTEDGEKYKYEDKLTLYGNSDDEIFAMWQSMHLSQNHKQYFRSLWNK